MEIIQITAIGLISVILSLSIKKQAPEFSLLISIAAGVIIFLMLTPKLIDLVSLIQQISVLSGTNQNNIALILKIIGISYISEFGSSICKDAGESALGSKIEMAGKLLIMVIATPILVSLLDLILSI